MGRIKKKLRENVRKIEVEEKSNIASVRIDHANGNVNLYMTANDDSSFIDKLKEGEVKDIFARICNASLGVRHRITALNSLFLARVVTKYPMYERCGLLNRFEQVLAESADNLQNGNHGNVAFQTQMMSLHFLSAIVMLKNYNNTGRDGIDEIYSLKLLKYADIWTKYFAMIQMRHCHIEFIRFLFRVLTLMLNSAVCAKYIIAHLSIDNCLMYLVSICKETVDKTQFDGCTEQTFDAMQGLSWVIYYQMMIQSQKLKIRKDVQKILKENDNQMYKMIVYPMAEKQIAEHRGISFKEAGECMKEAIGKKQD